MATNTTEWSWIGKSRRHTLRLSHQILTGKQDILLNDVSVLSTGWRFRLTGTIQIPADDSVLELYLLADEWGLLHYKLTVDGKIIAADSAAGGASSGGGAEKASSGGSSSPASPTASASSASKAAKSPAAAVGCAWLVHVGGGRTCPVEYRYATMDILVNDIKAAVEGEFVEEEEEEGAEAEVGGGAGGAGAPTVSGVRYKLLLGPSLVEGVLTVIPSETGRGPPTSVLLINGVIQRQRLLH